MYGAVLKVCTDQYGIVFQTNIPSPVPAIAHGDKQGQLIMPVSQNLSWRVYNDSPKIDIHKLKLALCQYGIILTKKFRLGQVQYVCHNLFCIGHTVFCAQQATHCLQK